jgi:hypothetical protein
LADPCRSAGDPEAFSRCADGLGLRSYVIYQPSDRFWVYQGIESGTYMTLALLRFLGAWWHVRTRIA